MKFRFMDFKQKQGKSKYLFGFYTLSKINNKNIKINSKFLNILALLFVGIFFLSMLLSLLFFSSVVYYKFTVIGETITTKLSNPSILLPSFNKDSLREIAIEQQKLSNNEISLDDVKRRYIIFTPFYFFLPLIFITMLIHEFGHYLMCRRTGVKVKEYGIGMVSLFCIPLLPFAFVNPTKKDLKSIGKFSFFSIISAGVSLNLLIGALFLIFATFFQVYFLYLLFLINISIALFNALPLGPLDGGQFVGRISSKLNLMTSIFTLLLLFLLFI